MKNVGKNGQNLHTGFHGALEESYTLKNCTYTQYLYNSNCYFLIISNIPDNKTITGAVKLIKIPEMEILSDIQL